MLTYIIIGFTCLVSIMSFQNRDMYAKLLFNSYIIHNNKQWYRFVTHAFVHADWLHLGFNMLSMVFFGVHVEQAFVDIFGEIKGEVMYLVEYILAIVMSSAYDFEKHKHNAYYSAVGASGGVFAILFTFILFFPTHRIGMMFLPRMPGFIMGPLLLILSLYLAKRGTDNIGHAAHFGGAIFGLIFPICMKFELLSACIFEIQQYLGR